MATLKMRKAGQVLREFPLATETITTIGRSPANSIVIDDRASSRKHCMIKVFRGDVRLIDMGSANGTKVDGERVHEKDLRGGEVLTIGETEFVYER
ncbi:MAG: FHA domain-containing protein [Planctomycetes bacterium]|nr:FHA domain-containing protein [Planctomycetota bacterium]